MELALQILSAAQAIEKAGQRLFKPHGLTVAQFNVLNVLSDQPDGLRLGDLAKALVVDPSNVTGLVQRMTKDGYLKLIPGAIDRRQRIVALSPKGQRSWRDALPDYRRALQQFEASVSKSDRAAALRVIRQVFEATSA